MAEDNIELPGYFEVQQPKDYECHQKKVVTLLDLRHNPDYLLINDGKHTTDFYGYLASELAE